MDNWTFDAPPIVHEAMQNAMIDYLIARDKEWDAFITASYAGLGGGDPCEMCGRLPWIMVDHPLTKKRVCLECKMKGTEGWVPCPATHKEGTECVLCRATPGFLPEA